MPMDYEQQWTEIGLLLEDLEHQLLDVSDDSPHALQAEKILKNVHACRDNWQFFGPAQGVGRPSGVFPRRGDGQAFSDGLRALLTEYGGDKTIMVPNINKIYYPNFYALLYDACVQYDVASGRDDLKAFHELISRVSKSVLGEEVFKMAYPTLTQRVNEWGDYEPNATQRVFLHTLSPAKISDVSIKRKISQEKAKLQAVVDLARRFKLLP